MYLIRYAAATRHYQGKQLLVFVEREGLQLRLGDHPSEEHSK
jgi:hypothetical protein